MPRQDRGLLKVVVAASAVSLFSFLYYLQRGEVLLYGDAVAHINIARRVFDSQTPGLLQLGTVWLPLPHVLAIPFLISDWLWQSGLGGSIPSMIAYVFGVAGVFRLTYGILQTGSAGFAAIENGTARMGAWIAALVYGANPNLIYMQATAMTEASYLGWFIWSVGYFSEFVRSLPADSTKADTQRVAHRALFRCAVCVAGAELTRYDGWLLAGAIGLAAIFIVWKRWSEIAVRKAALKFLLAISAAPILWLAYNAAVYRNPIEFANGPYSAKAIEQRTASPGAPAHPGAKNIVVAASLFLKSAQLNMAEGNWGRLWVVVLLAGSVLAATRIRARVAIALLWVPVAFYALSIAYGGVPIFLPTWWPFSHYNVRYGLQLLPLFAVSAGLLVAAASETRVVIRARTTAIALVIALTAASYFFVWKAQPLCWQEAWFNSRTKLTLESAVAKNVSRLPRDSTYLMYLGDHVGAFQQAGIPLRRTINEGNHRPWKKPVDPDGLWERALADPPKYADYVIAFEGDAVDQAVAKDRLTLLTVIHTQGQPAALIYVTRALNQSR